MSDVRPSYFDGWGFSEEPEDLILNIQKRAAADVLSIIGSRHEADLTAYGALIWLFGEPQDGDADVLRLDFERLINLHQFHSEKDRISALALWKQLSELIRRGEEGG